MRKGITKSTLTRKSQVTIPKMVRDAIGLEPGDQVDFLVDENAGNKVYIAPTPSLTKKFYGAGRKYAKTKKFQGNEVEHALEQEAKEVAKEGLD
jgi:AbrB family looped-hinge helix DNA binding protein